MVKRRNSRYKAFDWGALRRVPIDCTPQPLPPMGLADTKKARRAKLWSIANPSGSFVL
jgi:hypothetical protein